MLSAGADIANDSRLQARLFSYLDTQITRLGGSNFDQILINRPHVPSTTCFAMASTRTECGAAWLRTIRTRSDGGCPLLASADSAARIEVPEVVLGRKIRQAPATFDDHFSQACLFYRSLSDRAGARRRGVHLRASAVGRRELRSRNRCYCAQELRSRNRCYYCARADCRHR